MSTLDHDKAGTTYTADSKTRTVATVKGDHRNCAHKHSDGICHARHGWQLCRKEEDGPYSITPIVINKSVEPRARVVYESMFDDTKEPWNINAQKGWLAFPSEFGDPAKVKPSPEVVAEILRTHEFALGQDTAGSVVGPNGVIAARSAKEVFRAETQHLRPPMKAKDRA